VYKVDDKVEYRGMKGRIFGVAKNTDTNKIYAVKYTTPKGRVRTNVVSEDEIEDKRLRCSRCGEVIQKGKVYVNHMAVNKIFCMECYKELGLKNENLTRSFSITFLKNKEED